MAGNDFFIRRSMDQSEIVKLYVGYPNMFSIKLHHGGSFTRVPGSTYNGGKVNFIDLIDIDQFSVHELDGTMGELDYPLDEDPIYYHFLVPGETQLDFGLRALGNDTYVLNLSKYVSENKLIDVYTEVWRTNVHTYFCSPAKVTIEEIIDEGPSDVKSSGKDHDTIDINYDELFSYDNLQCEHEEDATVVDVQHDHNVHHDQNAHHDNAFMDNTMGDIWNFSGEEDSVEDDNDQEDKDEEDSDSDDSDFIVDEVNRMSEFDVDMMDYKMNVDLDVNDTIEDENVENDTLDNDIIYIGDEEDVNAASVRREQLKYLRKLNEGKANFYIGQMFGTKSKAKILIQDHAVETRRNIKIIKDDGGRVRVICKGPLPTFEIREDRTQVGCSQQKHRGSGAEKNKDKGKEPELPKVKNVGGRGKTRNPHLYQCPWTLFIGKDSETESWMVKTLNTTHKCLQTRSLNVCTSTCLAKGLIDQVEENPTILVRAVQEQFQRQFEVGISKMKAYRAKVKAKQQVEGDYFSQYELLWDYAYEIKKANLGTTVRIDVEQPGIHIDITRKFRRIYVCYGALKEGFKALGRDLLGLDGAFMKGPFSV
ncbi:hypothetical protein QVD17_41369 [Tagetes erecta]|uniref:PB1-like domain-containing protein n=1 Tax=Tagetes erecta TaxID=13708 RepID=A0AAD8NDM0_TARER|nr:hypothetical protein QVD17_41369 [Tagetes erecta]